MAYKIFNEDCFEWMEKQSKNTCRSWSDCVAEMFPYFPLRSSSIEAILSMLRGPVDQTALIRLSRSVQL